MVTQDKTDFRRLMSGYISDMVSDLLYYDRKEDEDLQVEDIDNAVKNGVISIDDIVYMFRKELTDGIRK